MNINALTNLSKTKQQIRMYHDMLKEMDGIGSYCFGEIRLLGGSGSRSRDKMLNLMTRRDSVRMKIESAYSQYLEQMERAKHMLDSIEDETIRTIFTTAIQRTAPGQKSPSVWAEKPPPTA